MLFTRGLRGRTKLTAKACVHLLKALRRQDPRLREWAGGVGEHYRAYTAIRGALHLPGTACAGDHMRLDGGWLRTGDAQAAPSAPDRSAPADAAFLEGVAGAPAMS